MRALLRFIMVGVMVVACLVGFVVASYRFNWPWLGSVPGSSVLKPYAEILWDWLMVHLLVVIAVFVAGLVLLRLTGRRRRGQAGQVPHPFSGWLNKRRATLKRPDHGAEIASRHGHERSPEWPRVEREHRLREPGCVACGYKGEGLQVHHIKPFHLHPHLELDPDNLITLCQVDEREHHLLLGHLDEWASYNEHVRADAKHFYRKKAARIRADLAWQKKMMQRP
jgi:5-methylcytosine-specific restriction endonuclease McrA